MSAHNNRILAELDWIAEEDFFSPGTLRVATPWFRPEMARIDEEQSRVWVLGPRSAFEIELGAAL